jgi:hypothetical protein
MYLCGSQALNYWECKPFDESKDFDIVISEEELNERDLSFDGRDQFKQGNIEFINVELLNNKVLQKYVHWYSGEYIPNFEKVKSLSLAGLWIMKRSHLFRPLKFPRHIMEFQKIKSRPSPLKKEDLSVLRERIRLTKQKFGDRVPTLNKTNQEFFNDKVTKYYVHDDLHKIVAYTPNSPIYERLKVDSGLAKCEKDLWYKLSHEDKVNCVREEGYVIALERFIIPKLESGEKHMPMSFAFDAALEKICTTLTSGFFRDFAIDNWQEIRSDIVDFLGLFHSQKNSLERLK